MITASTFVHSHSSFWKECFPALENYVRAVNCGAYTRSLADQQSLVEPSRSFIISETSFCLVRHGVQRSNIETAYQEARLRLSGLPGVPDDEIYLTDQEISFVFDLANRTKIVLESIAGENSKIVFDPTFTGCGRLSKSYGDIIAGQVLIEVKSVDRGFRATDYRQLMTYVFQNLASGLSNLEYIAILNAKRGIFHKAKIEQFVFDTSASSIIDIQSKFLAAIGFGGISR